MWLKYLPAIASALSVAVGSSGLLIGHGYVTASSGELLTDQAFKLGSGYSVRCLNTAPDILYHQVWTWIHDDYYDLSCNHQRWERWEHRYDGLVEESG